MILRTEMKRNRRAAFTLMEMLIVVAIIVALAGIGGFYLMGAKGEADKDIARTQAKGSLTSACQAYSLKHNGQYPDSLETLLQQDARGGPYLEDRDALKDPWGIAFMYDRTGPRNNGRKPDIWTKGPDGVEIGNWPATQQ
jgi:general secretion pathway protein G